MPLYRFTGLVPVTYPETRDARDLPLGTVEPGDERDFGQAPDQWWVPAGDGQGGDVPAADAVPDGAVPEPAPEAAPEPQPAPAAVPPAFVPPAVQA